MFLARRMFGPGRVVLLALRLLCGARRLRLALLRLGLRLTRLIVARALRLIVTRRLRLRLVLRLPFALVATATVGRGPRYVRRDLQLDVASAEPEQPLASLVQDFDVDLVAFDTQLFERFLDGEFARFRANLDRPHSPLSSCCARAAAL